jgi:uncharacterized protein DUF2637
VTATDRPQPDARAAEPLGTGWAVATIAIGVFAALIAAGGMVLSFRAVSAEMVPAFGAQWAWLVPLVTDFTVLVFSGVDLVLARRAIPHPLARLTVYGATAGTVWLNYGAGGNLVGRIAHILMPSIWVMFVELMRHVVRHEAHLVGTSVRQPIPAARWLLSPWPTAKLWRRMILWQVNSYTVALGHERERLRRTAQLRHEHGRLWRLRVTPLVRLELDLGPAETVADGSTETAPPVPAGTAGTAARFTLEPGTGSPETPATVPGPSAATGNRNPGGTRRRVSRNAATPQPSSARVGVLLPKDQQRKIVADLVETLGADVPLAVITGRLDCSKATASRLRAEAAGANDRAEDPEPAEAVS